jgi:hypothetical protein
VQRVRADGKSVPALDDDLDLFDGWRIPAAVFENRGAVVAVVGHQAHAAIGL